MGAHQTFLQEIARQREPLTCDSQETGREAISQFTLDALCEMFGVIPHDRHRAPGDAFLTAQVFLRLLRIAAKHGRSSLGQPAQPFEPDEG